MKYSMKEIAKAITAAVVMGSGTIVQGLSDGKFTAIEIVTSVAATIVAGLAVFIVPNEAS